MAATTLGKKAGKGYQMAFQLLLRLELIYDWVEIWGVVQTKVLRGSTTVGTAQVSESNQPGFRSQPRHVLALLPSPDQ